MILGLDGHQCGDKLVSGLEAGAIDGVVLTLRYRRPDNLQRMAIELADGYAGTPLMIDPCTCYMTHPTRGLGQYPAYPFTFNGLNRRGFRNLNLLDWATQSLEYQAQLRVTDLIGPGIPLEAFDDYRSELALETYAATYSAHQNHASLQAMPLLHSLSFQESALSSIETTSDYLDLLTQVAGDGFYLTVSRDTDSDPQWGDATRVTRLANLMYLVYTLSLNGYRVIYSYSDIVGLLTLAAGGSDLVAGWFGTTRQLYSGGLGRPRRGGGVPRALYASRPLLSWLLMATDLASVMAAGLTDSAVDSAGFDARVREEGAGTEWQRRTEVLHFWHTLSALEQVITADDSPEVRARVLESLVVDAIRSVADIESARVRLEKRPTHLPAWLQAIQTFQSMIPAG